MTAIASTKVHADTISDDPCEVVDKSFFFVSPFADIKANKDLHDILYIVLLAGNFLNCVSKAMMIKASKQANKEKDSQTNCQMNKQPNNDKTKTKNLTDKQKKKA